MIHVSDGITQLGITLLSQPLQPIGKLMERFGHVLTLLQDAAALGEALRVLGQIVQTLEERIQRPRETCLRRVQIIEQGFDLPQEVGLGLGALEIATGHCNLRRDKAIVGARDLLDTHPRAHDIGMRGRCRDQLGTFTGIARRVGVGNILARDLQGGLMCLQGLLPREENAPERAHSR